MTKSKLKFVADESLEYTLAKFLRNKGHDVISIAEESPSLKDSDVLKIANKHKAVLLTNDKDFGELVFLNKLPHKGIILFRTRSERVKVKLEVLETLLAKYSDRIEGNFVVVDEGKVRIR